VLTTIFGDVTFQDPYSLKAWLQAHDMNHRTYGRVSAQNGKPLQPTLLP
jgi:hypothetical protein